MAEAIVTWTEGDLVIQQMRSLAEQAHQRVIGGDSSRGRSAEMREQAVHLNKRLTQLESKFSAQLGEARGRRSGCCWSSTASWPSCSR